MTDDEQVEEHIDLIARYLVCRLSLALENHERYAGAVPGQRRIWVQQLDEAKRELIANGLAKVAKV